MKAIAIGHHPETPRGDATGGRMGGRRVVTERSSWITMTALSFLALIGGAAAQFTGTYYPEAPVNVGAGSEPLLIPGGAAPQLLFGNGAGLHVGQLDQFGALEPSPKQIDARTGLLHSKHVATYEDGSYALTLEVPLNKVEACKYGSNWELTKCTPIYTWATNDPDRFSSDIAASPSSTMVTLHHYAAASYIKAFFALLGPGFEKTISDTYVVSPTSSFEHNPSVIWLGNKFSVGLEKFQLVLPEDYQLYYSLETQSTKYSEAGASLGSLTTIPGSGSVDSSSPLEMGPPNLKLSDLGAFGHAEAWESESPSPTGYYVHFMANDGSDLGTYNLNTSGNIRTGVFTEINPTMVAGAWAWDAASDNKVILELFERSGNSVVSVASSSFTVFADPTNVYTSISVAALPNEAGVVVTAEKAGFIWTRVISFIAPTPMPTGNQTPPPTGFPTSKPTPTPTNLPGAPSPSEQTSPDGSAFDGTEEDTSAEGSSTGNGHTFTAMTPAPPTPATVTLMRNESAGEGSPLGLIVGVTVGVVGCSAIAVGVARSLRRGSFRDRKGPVSGRDKLARRVSSRRVSLQAVDVTGPMTQGNAPPAPGDNMTGLYTPTSRYERVPALPGQASTGVTYSGLGVAQPMGQTYGAAAVAPANVNYDSLVPGTGAPGPRYDSPILAEGGQQRSSYERACTPLKV